MAVDSFEIVGIFALVFSISSVGLAEESVLPHGDAFPEFGEGYEQRLTNLRALVERAAKFGVGVYLYLNEPRAMPPAFFENRPDMAGVQETELTALCTSHPAVRQWMGDALAHILREVPGLGGVYTITASENLTNCASHGAWTSCAYCKLRSGADIISEVVSVIEEGVHRGNPSANALVSDWGWRGHGDAPDIIARLPKSVWLMSVSEWALPIERGGIKSIVGEYSISSVGPGPRSLKHWQVAEEAGLKTGMEIQFNNTCEIASVLYPPEVFADQFEKVAEGWRPGIVEMQAAVENAPPELRSGAVADLRLARAVAIHFQSVANQARFVLARDKLAESSEALRPVQREEVRAEIKHCLESEIKLARELYTLVREDSRIGFAPSAMQWPAAEAVPSSTSVPSRAWLDRTPRSMKALP